MVVPELRGLPGNPLPTRPVLGEDSGSTVREWRNGIRGGLRIRRGNPCGFESHLSHQSRPALRRAGPKT